MPPETAGFRQCAFASRCRHSGGAILLEVILALTLFFLTAGVVTGSLYTSIRAARTIKLSAQAEDLAVTKQSELKAGILPVVDAGPEPFAQEGDLAQWTWQVVTAPVDQVTILQGPQLKRVEIIIHNVPANYTCRLSEIMSSAVDEGEATIEPASTIP